MERSWLQQHAALSKFDGFRDSEPLSCVKPTAAPAPSLSSTASPAPEAGQSVDVVYDPHDASADWSGFAPRHCSGRRMHASGPPAAYRETIERSEEHGIVPAADTDTQDSVRARRRRCAEPSRNRPPQSYLPSVGCPADTYVDTLRLEEVGVVLGGPAAPGPEERFNTCARAANAHEPTPIELKSETYRCQKNAGKRHMTPAYEQRGATIHTAQAGRRPDQAGDDLWAPRGNPLLHPASLGGDNSGNNLGDQTRAPAGPGSLLKGLGRQVAESGSLAGLGNPPGRRQGGEEAGATPVGAEGLRTKCLYATNYNAHMTGYTGHQPRK